MPCLKHVRSLAQTTRIHKFNFNIVPLLESLSDQGREPGISVKGGENSKMGPFAIFQRDLLLCSNRESSRGAPQPSHARFPSVWRPRCSMAANIKVNADAARGTCHYAVPQVLDEPHPHLELKLGTALLVGCSTHGLQHD